MRGGRGRAKSAAQYEYVSSPSAFKNKIHPSQPKNPCKMQKSAGLYHKQETIVHIPPIMELVQKMQGFPKNKILKF